MKQDRHDDSGYRYENASRRKKEGIPGLWEPRSKFKKVYRITFILNEEAEEANRRLKREGHPDETFYHTYVEGRVLCIPYDIRVPSLSIIKRIKRKIYFNSLIKRLEKESRRQ